MTWLLYTFGSRCCLLSFFLLRLHRAPVDAPAFSPLCLCPCTALWQSEEDLQHPWRVTFAVRPWLWQVNAVTAQTRSPHTPLLLCFKHCTATDLFKYECAVFVSCSMSLLWLLLRHNEDDLHRQSSTVCSWFSLIFCVCPQPIKRRSKSSPWCLCSAHAWTHALQKTWPTRQKVKNLLYTSTGAY